LVTPSTVASWWTVWPGCPGSTGSLRGETLERASTLDGGMTKSSGRAARNNVPPFSEIWKNRRFG
jgi:hypothetical protein